MRRWSVSVAVLTVLSATAAFAGWGAVQRIRENRKIKVMTRAGVRVDGRFVSATDSTLVIRYNSGEESIGRAHIAAVRVADPARRGRWGAIGAAIGAGIGLGLSYPVCERFYNEGGDRSSCMASITLPAAGGGAALGFLPLRYRLVYEGKRLQRRAESGSGTRGGG
jgi:hypothetical protein